ncbi:type III-A CRISPR-associated RAMP protein Csm5, partial [Candidatus Hakubella thermalkaliphila]
MEKTIVDNYKLKIEVLSCVHIGSGNEFYPYECFFEVDGNPPKFITFNINRFLLDHPQDALKIFMDGSPVIKPLWKYEGIKKYLTQRIYKDTICQISRDNINEIMNIWENQRKVSVFQFIKTTDNNAYIPGSSLKGFIRTALAYYFLKNGWAKLTQDRQAIEDIFRDDGEINKDLFRLWSISDSQTPSYNTAIIQAKVLSKGLIRNDLRNFYEVLLPTTTLGITFNFMA